MVRFEKRCNICKQIMKEYEVDGNSKLERRLYQSKRFVTGGEPVKNIANELGLNYLSLNIHLKKHQNPSAEVLIESNMRENGGKAVKTSEEIQDKLVEEGFNQLEAGNLKMSAATLAKIAKDKQDREEKNKDRAFKVMEMVFAYASRDQLPPSQPTGNYLPGER